MGLAEILRLATSPSSGASRPVAGTAPGFARGGGQDQPPLLSDREGCAAAGRDPTQAVTHGPVHASSGLCGRERTGPSPPMGEPLSYEFWLRCWPSHVFPVGLIRYSLLAKTGSWPYPLQGRAGSSCRPGLPGRDRCVERQENSPINHQHRLRRPYLALDSSSSARGWSVYPTLPDYLCSLFGLKSAKNRLRQESVMTI